MENIYESTSHFIKLNISLNFHQKVDLDHGSILGFYLGNSQFLIEERDWIEEALNCCCTLHSYISLISCIHFLSFKSHTVFRNMHEFSLIYFICS